MGTQFSLAIFGWQALITESNWTAAPQQQFKQVLLLFLSQIFRACPSCTCEPMPQYPCVNIHAVTDISAGCQAEGTTSGSPGLRLCRLWER